METPRTVDVRWLEPPEPMERILEAVGDLPPGQSVRVLIHREPFPLYNVLRRNAYDYRATALDDGTFEILIWPAAPKAGQ